MDINIVTKEDLRKELDELRTRLLKEIKEILGGAPGTRKEWLKSDEVRKLLGISVGTLQNLRITGKLNPSKIGGTHYYKLTEIESLLSLK